MTDRLLQRLLLATAISGTAALVIALSSAGYIAAPDTKPAMDASTARPAATLPLAAAQQPTLLPLVVVRPDAPIHTLATVTVRASLADAIEADAADVDEPDLLGSSVGTPALYPLPSAAFDMPYYSFGKTLRRVNKE